MTDTYDSDHLFPSYYVYYCPACGRKIARDDLIGYISIYPKPVCADDWADETGNLL